MDERGLLADVRRPPGHRRSDRRPPRAASALRRSGWSSSWPPRSWRASAERRHPDQRPVRPGHRRRDGGAVDAVDPQRHFNGRARTIAFAVWGSAIGGMAAVGPLRGRLARDRRLLAVGVLAQHPRGPAGARRHREGGPRERDESAEPGSDLPGVLLSALGMGGAGLRPDRVVLYGWWRTDDGALSPVPFALVGGWSLIAGVRRGRAAPPGRRPAHPWSTSASSASRPSAPGSSPPWSSPSASSGCSSPCRC